MSLRPVQQAPVDTVADVDATTKTAAETWQAIVDAAGFQRVFVEAVREIISASDYSAHFRSLALVDAGVTVGRGAYASVLSSLVHETWDRQYQEAITTTRRFGAAEPSILGPLDLAGLPDGPLAVLDAADCEPTITIRLRQQFRERDYAARETLADLLAMLGTVCDIRVAATGLTAHFLAGEHRGRLPAEFSERARATRGSGSPIAERVATARDALDPDGRAVTLLRRLTEEPGQTLSRHALASEMTVSDGRISQLLGELEALDCITRFSNGSGKRVELQKTGVGVIDAIDAEIGQQSELDAEFSATGQNQLQCRVNAGALGEGEDGPADRPAPHRTEYAPASQHHPTAAAAAAGGVRAVEAPVEECDTRIRWVSYNHSRREAYIAVPASTPLQTVVGTACALASPEFLNRALPDDRLESIDIDATLLRSARCIGALDDEAANDAYEFRSNLIEWGQEVQDLTTKLKREEYEDRDRFRGEIMRAAHGLAGSVAHLLDAADIDVVREYRVPAGLPDDRLEALAETLAQMARIQSRYRTFAVYRQLFEDREEKRRSAISPTVDAADPTGNLIGGFVLRGRDTDRLAEHVATELRDKSKVHEDAPDIAVPVRVNYDAREVYAATVERLCRSKNLDPTREAVTLLRTLTSSPWAVGEALAELGSETTARAITADEVRYALATLDPSALLPDCAPSVGKLTAALLRTDDPLSQTELAEAADVSTRTVRRNIGLLEALTLVEETSEGYRFALPTREERHEDIRPAVMDDPNAARQDLLFDIALVLVDDLDRFGDPQDPLCQAFGPTFDEAAFRTAVPDAEPWVRPARLLCAEPDREPTTVTVGETPTQTALTETTG